MSRVFLRPELAAQLVRQILRPGQLDESCQAGFLVYGLRRTGKTTFLKNDLIAALEKAGAQVVYVDLWSNPLLNPAKLVRRVVHETLEASVSRLMRNSRACAEVQPLAEELTALVNRSKSAVVLIIDEVQHAMATKEGNRMLGTLKEVAEAINRRVDTPGAFRFVGTSSQRAWVNKLTAWRPHAFAEADAIPFPVLGADYVSFVLKRLSGEGGAILPSLKVATEAFTELGYRPEYFIIALKQLSDSLPRGANPDRYFPVIAATIHSRAADVELNKVAALGGLATAIFDWVASTSTDGRGLFTAATAAEFSRAVDRNVRISEVQPVINQLVRVNLIMRCGRGRYCVTDPSMTRA